MGQFIVLDLEWNQSPAGKEGSMNRLPFEIIEIGAVKLNKNLQSILSNKDILNKDKVKALIENLKESFDIVLLDSPAGIESGFEHSIFLADRALIVSTPDVSSVRDADRVIGIIDAKSEKAKNGQEVEKHIIINRIKPEMVEAGNMLSVEDVLSILALPLIGIVPDDEDIITSTNTGSPIVNKEKSLSAEAYRNIARRILGEEVEFLDIRAKKGLIATLKGIFK